MRIFGVGLNKTGTTSLTEACRTLGFRTMHHRALRLDPNDITARIDRAVAEGKHPLQHAARLRVFQGFFDMRSVSRHFEAFDEHYPGSKFILHTRELEPWLDSRDKHVGRNTASGSDSRWTTHDRDASRALFEQQTARVLRHFADRPDDLLVIDVTEGQGWDVLCPFLGVPVPASPFPFANRAPKPASQPGS